MKKYEKIAEWIRDEVDAGTLSLGDKLPPENELMAQFQVSRQTVRTALSLLRKEGIVEGRRAGPAAVCRLYAGADGKRSEDTQPGCDLDRFQ